MSKKRHRLPRRASRKMFTNTAMKVNPKNLQAVPMRGGFRL